MFEDVTGAIRQTAFETHPYFGNGFLKATGLLVGLLVSFGATKLPLRRFVYQTSRSGTRSAVGST